MHSVEGETPKLETPYVMQLAQDLARHSGARQAQIAKNIANADTPGYHARDLKDFSETYQQKKSETEMRLTRSGHIVRSGLAGEPRTFEIGGEAAPNGNDVSLAEQMSLSTDARSKHNLALTVYNSALDVLRTSIGRGR